MTSPYAVPTGTVAHDYPAQAYDRYAAPDISEDAPYLDSPFGAYADQLNRQGLATPDAFRLGTQKQQYMRPQPNRPAEEFYRPQDANTAQRHSVETQDADGFQTQLPGTKPVAPHPNSRPTPEPRPTNRLSPRTYTFLRPFDQQNVAGTRRFNGRHFSMADHRRNYEIYGMTPPRTSRNTYRLDPGPWDANIVDLPPDTTPQTGPRGPIQAVDVPVDTRTWRLG